MSTATKIGILVVPSDHFVLALWSLIGEAQLQLRRPFERIRHALGTASEAAEITRSYQDLPRRSLSRYVFERFPSRLAAVTVREVYWSDWGREERIDETLLRLGKQAGAALGPVAGVGSAGALPDGSLWAAKSHRLPASAHNGALAASEQRR